MRALRARGLIVRAMGGYSLPHCLRITIGTAEECGMVRGGARRRSCAPDG